MSSTSHRTQRAERHDEHAVVAAVGVGSHTDENHQEGGGGGVPSVYLSCESNQGLRRVIGHVRSQFGLHEPVFAVTQANDGIDFQAVFIQEMVHIPVESRSVNAQVPDGHILKKQAHGGQIMNQLTEGLTR